MSNSGPITWIFVGIGIAALFVKTLEEFKEPGAQPVACIEESVNGS